MTKTTEKKSTSLSRLELRQSIHDLLDEGYKRREIAEKLGVNRHTVNRLSYVSGIRFKRGGSRKLSTHPKNRIFDVIDKVAADALVSRSTIVSRLLDVSAPDVATAKKNLGKLALPVRKQRGSVANG